MSRRVVTIPGLSHGDLPIPLAAVKDGLLISGGISAIDPATGHRSESLEAQIAQLWANVRAILDAAGFTPDDVVKMTFYVADGSTRSLINAGWLELFPDEQSRPARHTLVQQLSAGQQIQAELIAISR